MSDFSIVKVDGGDLSFFQKLVGPIVEAGDLLTDKIRFIRWKSSLKTIKRAREISEEAGLPINEVPMKFLIPFMEKSSLEDEGDENIIEKWATLLSAASADPANARTIHIDILSRLSPQEVGLLEILLPSGAIETLCKREPDVPLMTIVLPRIFARRDFIVNKLFEIIDKTIEEKSEYTADLKEDLTEKIESIMGLKIDGIVIETITVNFKQKIDDGSSSIYASNQLLREYPSYF